LGEGLTVTQAYELADKRGYTTNRVIGSVGEP